MAQNIVEILLRARDDSQPAVRSYTDGLKQIKNQVAELKSIQQQAAKDLLATPSGGASIAARADLTAVTKDLKVAEADLSATTKALGNEAGATSGSFGSLFKSFTAANLAATAITAGVGLIRQQMTASVQAATAYQNAMLGLSVTAGTFGESQGRAKDQAKSLASDGLIAVTTSASGLKQLMDSGLGLDQAVQLMQVYKDRAAFGRTETIGYDQAVGNLAQTFKTESSELGNASGMTENYSQILQTGANILGKNVTQLDAAERAQAKYLGTIQLSTSATGNAARFADSDAGAMARQANAATNLQVTIGSALQPALSLLADGFAKTINGANGGGDAMKYTQMAVASLAFVVRSAADTIVSAAQLIFAGMTAITTLTWQPVEDALNQSVDRQVRTWTDFNDSVNQIAKGSGDVQVAEQGRALGAMTSAQQSAIRKMQEQLAEENLSFERSTADRAKQFQEAMTDMIISHRDKSRSLQNDIAAENRAYDQQLAARTKDLNEDLASLEEGHADKVADITKKLTEERGKGLIVDGVLYAEANQKKIDELQASLDEETTKYQRQVEKRRATYAEDIAEDQARHDAKLTQLQTELASELAILNTHREQVAAVGEAQKEDELSRLVRQNQEAVAIADRDHQERLNKIRAQASEQGSTFGSSYAGSAAASLGAGNPAMSSAARVLGTAVGASVADGVKSGLDERAKTFNFASWANDMSSRMVNAIKAHPQLTAMLGLIIPGASALPAIAGLAGQLSNLWDSIKPRAQGGPVTAGRPYLVGEREAELFVPSTNGRILNQNQIASAMGNGGSSGPAIHIDQVNNYTQVDWAAFQERLAWGVTR